MAANWVGSLISGVGSLLGSIIGAGASLKQSKNEQEWSSNEAEINRDYQTEEREATQEWNLDMWNLANEYYTPEAQMERYAQIGLNPNAAMSLISGSQGPSSVAASSPQSGAMASHPGSIAGSLGSQIGNSVNSALSAGGAYLDNAIKEADANARPELNNQQIQSMIKSNKNLDVQYNKIVAEGKKIGIEAHQLETMLPFVLAKSQQELEEGRNRIETMKIERDKVRYDIMSTIQSIKESMANEDLINAKTQTELLNQKNISEDIRLKKLDGLLKQFQVLDEQYVLEFRNLTGLSLKQDYDWIEQALARGNQGEFSKGQVIDGTVVGEASNVNIGTVDGQNISTDSVEEEQVDERSFLTKVWDYVSWNTGNTALDIAIFVGECGLMATGVGAAAKGVQMAYRGAKALKAGAKAAKASKKAKKAAKEISEYVKKHPEAVKELQQYLKVNMPPGHYNPIK